MTGAQNQEGELMIVSPERLRDLRRVSQTPVAYPSADFDAAQSFLAGAVPELLDTVDGLCRVLISERERLTSLCWCATQEAAQ